MNRNTNKNVLGVYHLGEYYTESSFEDCDLWRNYFATEQKLLTSITAYHECLHFLHDIGTGFGCLASEIIRGRNEEILFRLRRLDKAVKIPLPIKKHIALMEAGMSKEIILECIDQYESWNSILDKFFNTSYLMKILEPLNTESNKECYIETASKIGPVALLEGAATLFSNTFCSEFAKNFEKCFIEKINHNLPQEYTLSSEYISRTVIPHYSNKPLAEKFNLLFLLTDLALHVPPITVLFDLCESHKNSFIDFIPGFRFFKSIQAIGLLDLEFPDFSREGYSRFVDAICRYLNWPCMDTSTDDWITFLEDQHQKAPTDMSIEWKQLMMNERKKTPQLFATFSNTYSTISHSITEVPFLSQTKSSNWVHMNMDLVERWDDIRQVIAMKQFLNSTILQLFDEAANGNLVCPFIGSGFYKCDKEKVNCNNINTEDAYLNSAECMFSRGFESFFYHPISCFKSQTCQESKRR